MIGRDLSLYLLVGVAAFLLVRGLLSRGSMLRYPFLAAAVVAGWFAPQAIGLLYDKSLPPGGYTLTMLFAAASLIAVLLGEKWAAKPTTIRLYHHDEHILLYGAAILSSIGALAYFRYLATVPTLTVDGLLTGFMTILWFFSRFLFFGLALALLLLLRKFSWLALVIVVLDAHALSGLILYGGRRGPAVEIAMIVMCALWFQKRILPPRTLIIAAVLAAALLANSIGQYRSLIISINEYRSDGVAARLPTMDELLSIPFLQEFKEVMREGSFEARNAIYNISATYESLNFDFGLGLWNHLVHSYFPGQIMGFGMKQMLQFDLTDNARQVYGYRSHIGTTSTGFADSFRSFFVLGVLVFAAIGAFMQYWWRRAMLGSLEAQFYYCVLASTAMHAVTHSTQWFVAFLPQLFIFSAPLFWMARRRVGRIQTRCVAQGPDLPVRQTLVDARARYLPGQ
jgi:hypothetical protein